MDYLKTSLNGQWLIEPGPRKPAQYKNSIPVPGLVDMAVPGFNWQEHQYFWYRHDFEMEAVAASKQLLLQLEQVQFGTLVYLNDELIGGNIPCYTSQYFNLSPALRKGDNHLEIRVGTKNTLPPHSAVGNDFEKLSFIPGIWGDVWLHLHDFARMDWLRILPDLSKSGVNFHVEIEPLTEKAKPLLLEYSLVEKKTRRSIAAGSMTLQKPVIMEKKISTDWFVVIENAELWTPENPFLYEIELTLKAGDIVSDRKNWSFGMREFGIRDGHFYLNGIRRRLFGSNIAFHRLLSDPERRNLPWDEAWIRKVLVDIPKSHNMFFFRFHLGHVYNRWYDIADEYGIMIQDEWMFWNPTGTPRQITRVFSDWIKENGHHPSIVMWDPLNESKDDTITNEIIPKMKEVDPGRIWETADFTEDHPYIYSLGPVLHEAKFGYTRSLQDLQNSSTPVMVNEFLWWWLDGQGRPSELTRWVISRWLGRKVTTDQLLNHQAFLAAELTELFRRLDFDAIMPFVYLSAGPGATSHWFQGDLSALQPKPLLQALKQVFSPLGVSIELWNRHFTPGQSCACTLYFFNDTAAPATLTCRLSIAAEKNKPAELLRFEINPEPGEILQHPVNFQMPEKITDGWLTAVIFDSAGKEISQSRKKIQIVKPALWKINNTTQPVLLWDEAVEIAESLARQKLNFTRNTSEIQNLPGVILVNGTVCSRLTPEDQQRLKHWVEQGATLLLQEPELGLTDQRILPVLPDLNLWVQYRHDPERGGYDSVVIPEEPEHPLWQGLSQENLFMWNGAWGGEIISKHHIRPNRPFRTLASCNLFLRVPAVLEIPYGQGRVLISRLQLRGRLNPEQNNGNLFDRVYDPVTEVYLGNLLRYALEPSWPVAEETWQDHFKITRALATDGSVYDIEQLNLFARWPVYGQGRQRLEIEFFGKTEIRGLVFKKLKFVPDDCLFTFDEIRTECFRKDEQTGQIHFEFHPIYCHRLVLEYTVSSSAVDSCLWEIELV